MLSQDVERLLSRIIDQEDLIVHFQPVVHLQSQGIYGFEGLIRGPVDTPLHSPERLFAAATWTNRLAELDLLCRSKVIERFSQLRLPGRLFVNVDPVAMLNGSLQEGRTLKMLQQADLDPTRVIIELTETNQVEDIQLMQMAMEHYRRMGFRVAIDDLGAGYSGLKLWSEIRPDMVKVDRHFIHGVDEDRTKQQFVSFILRTATSLGARVITEGVETEREYATLRKIGVELVQGYYFCRPLALPPTNLASTLFRKEARGHEEYDAPTVEVILRQAIAVEATSQVLRVGELFTSTPELESVAVVSSNDVLGLVLRKDFMNIFASLYGKELFGRQPIHRFMNRKILQVEKKCSLEEVSFRLTTALDCHTEEFIILDHGKLAGKGCLIDLLHQITRLQVNRARHANPLTQLPGNVPIQQHLQNAFRSCCRFVICYFDLDNFKPFNDVLGFKRGDQVIQFVAELLSTNIESPENFIGHLGGDDFVVIFRGSDWEEVVRRILSHFDEGIASFYHGHEGCEIVAADRDGRVRTFGKMTLSAGAVDVLPSPSYCSIDLSEAAAIAKHHAKIRDGSALYTFSLERAFSAENQLGAVIDAA